MRRSADGRQKDKDNRSADIAELVDKVLEVPVGCVDAGEIGVERAIGALAGSLDPIVCQLLGGNGAIVVAAVICIVTSKMSCGASSVLSRSSILS